jgi:proteasome assembly chaperone (PAC2) family protein
MRGFCLLAETPGFYPDAAAAQQVLNAVNGMLHLKIDMNRLDSAAQTTREVLESFGLVAQPPGEKRGEEPYRWHI